MPTMHRPDFEAFRKESEADPDRGTKYRTLPLLLNARGRHPPSHFAAADIDAMHLGLVTKAIVPIFLNQYIMVLNGITENLLEYGKLVGWDEHPDAFDWMTKQKKFLPGEGLLILEVQERLLTALLKCCLQLLREKPPLKPESEITGFESLGIMAAEAPYRVPAELDLRLIESLLAARASAAEDHLWALREDPDYFSRAVLDAQDHRQEMLKDTRGMSHPLFNRGERDVLWARVIGSVVLDAYIGLEIFTELSSQAKKLASMQKKYSWVPPNCFLEVDDVLEDWAWREKFDLIHIRTMTGAFSEAEWESLYKTCYDNLRPGGWIKQLEYHPLAETGNESLASDNIIKEWGLNILDCAKRAGRTFYIIDTMVPRVHHVGFVNIHQKNYKIPVGPWARERQFKDAGMVSLQRWMGGMAGWSMRLFTKFGAPYPWSKEEVQVYVAKSSYMAPGTEDMGTEANCLGVRE
ncbi:uncharacterized protein N7496_010899 [Penicillium cataractarum]|uniref:Uncharacterized protein n=1 Tax=Penicillium cataractarum TaxID=2100454 RepID=A0A9W9RE38_9EURO|nr:uncharacterized protein N7496_010899 [Penicillium cataractarum]KAJ5358486.1 hypothetical protein N7496_010899 [Penicillium cataractarum]